MIASCSPEDTTRPTHARAALKTLAPLTSTPHRHELSSNAWNHGCTQRTQRRLRHADDTGRHSSNKWFKYGHMTRNHFFSSLPRPAARIPSSKSSSMSCTKLSSIFFRTPPPRARALPFSPNGALGSAHCHSGRGRGEGVSQEHKPRRHPVLVPCATHQLLELQQGRGVRRENPGVG